LAVAALTFDQVAFGLYTLVTFGRVLLRFGVRASPRSRYESVWPCTAPTMITTLAFETYAADTLGTQIPEHGDERDEQGGDGLAQHVPPDGGVRAG
jgi:hypothetical protein